MKNSHAVLLVACCLLATSIAVFAALTAINAQKQVNSLVNSISALQTAKAASDDRLAKTTAELNSAIELHRQALEEIYGNQESMATALGLETTESEPAATPQAAKDSRPSASPAPGRRSESAPAVAR